MPEDFDLGPFNDLLPPKPGAAGVGDLGGFYLRELWVKLVKMEA
jgi:hypothetical protein